ncbi:MAG: hypothetical protein R3355_15105 [Pseudomonas sp.]|uniref:hypothetical protein n=1 Tax=Pseudomonas sp. TaxID=306 RepID=UPI00299D9F59|nr:hypothetical protein [Pseudomonas sp.]MDX1724424.1 hypothetical protein [Pseudomonas sp.]
MAENAEFTSRKSAVRSHFQHSMADAQQTLFRLLGTDEGAIMPALRAGTTAGWSGGRDDHGLRKAHDDLVNPGGDW